MRLFALCALLLASILSPLSLAAHGQTSPPAALRVGAAKVDITPTDLTGFYSVWARRFTGVHDPIYARALVFDSGSTRAALVVTDLVEFGDTSPLRARIQRELNIPADHIQILATHDHNAPRGGPIVPGSSSAQGRPYSPPAYISLVDDRVVQAIREANAALQPARVGVEAGHADINVNRNGWNGKRFGGADPNGPSDKTLWVVKFEDLYGDPIALLMNYGVHSVVTGSSTLVSGDLGGAAERTVEAHYGKHVVALFAMGPAGDQNPIYLSDFQASSHDDPFVFEAANGLGLTLALQAIATADSIPHMEGSVRLSATESTFNCPTVPEKPHNPKAPSMFVPNPDFHEQIPYPASMDVHLSLLRLNDIALTGVSGEIFTRIDQRLRRESPLTDTLLLTMSNGRIGYIADDAEYFGPFGNPSLVQGCAENHIVNGLIDLMKQTDR